MNNAISLISWAMLTMGIVFLAVAVMAGLTHGKERYADQYHLAGIGLIIVSAIVANAANDWRRL